jgi:hypothetical protein
MCYAMQQLLCIEPATTMSLLTSLYEQVSFE